MQVIRAIDRRQGFNSERIEETKPNLASFNYPTFAIILAWACHINDVIYNTRVLTNGNLMNWRHLHTDLARNAMVMRDNHDIMIGPAWIII